MITSTVTYRGYVLRPSLEDSGIAIYFRGEFIDWSPDLETAKLTIDIWKVAP